MGSKKHFTRRTNLESYLLAYTLKGQGELVYEDRSYLLNPGDCFFIDCRKPHYYRTLDEYVKNMRINVAKTLLTGTDLSVYEIALQIGFNYSNYFYRVFQEMENTTPIQYRKQWKHSEGERS